MTSNCILNLNSCRKKDIALLGLYAVLKHADDPVLTKDVDEFFARIKLFFSPEVYTLPSDYFYVFRDLGWALSRPAPRKPGTRGHGGNFWQLTADGAKVAEDHPYVECMLEIYENYMANLKGA